MSTLHEYWSIMINYSSKYNYLCIIIIYLLYKGPLYITHYN
jgi:hypothetical protein